MIKLHIGCGKRNFGDDWVHIDKANYPHIKYHIIKFLPYQDKSVDLIYASHVIEYFDREEVLDVLREWYRVLNVGGILRLAVPDFREMAKLYINNDFPLDSFLGPLYGKMKVNDDFIYHKTVYDDESLIDILGKTGFACVRQWDWRKVDHGIFDDQSQAYLPKMDKKNGTLISLNIEAIK